MARGTPRLRKSSITAASKRRPIPRFCCAVSTATAFNSTAVVLRRDSEHYSDGTSVVPDERIQLAALHVRANLFERFICK